MNQCAMWKYCIMYKYYIYIYGMYIPYKHKAMHFHHNSAGHRTHPDYQYGTVVGSEFETR